MINTIVDYFYNLAKEHKLIKGFRYEQINKVAGMGDDYYPLLFLEDPIFVLNESLRNGTGEAELNFEVLFTPQAMENYDVDQPTISFLQGLASDVALNCISRIQTDYNNDEIDFHVADYNIVTVRRWYDDNACGVRVTLKLYIVNPLQFCDIEEHFDPDKEFSFDKYLNDYNTDDPNGCAIFDYKLKDFDL